jgi:hypothetical protein
VTEGCELNIFGMGDGDFSISVAQTGRKMPKISVWHVPEWWFCTDCREMNTKFSEHLR